MSPKLPPPKGYNDPATFRHKNFLRIHADFTEEELEKLTFGEARDKIEAIEKRWLEEGERRSEDPDLGLAQIMDDSLASMAEIVQDPEKLERLGKIFKSYGMTIEKAGSVMVEFGRRFREAAVDLQKVKKEGGSDGNK